MTRIADVISSPNSPWMRSSLSVKFGLVSLGVFIVLFAAFGWWVDRSIRSEVIRNSAANVALYVQSAIAPVLRGIGERNALTESEANSIQSLLDQTPLGKKILAIKIWKAGGRVIYNSQFPEQINQAFAVSDNLEGAWNGTVTAVLDTPTHVEDEARTPLDQTLLEVYSPLIQEGTGQIVAVVEFYQSADNLLDQLTKLRLTTWLMVLLTSLAAYLVLFGIVTKGSQTIVSQRHELQRRIDDLSSLLSRNQELSQRVARATQRNTKLTEQQLSRIGSDLHDGPAQTLGLALLQLDELSGDGTSAEKRATIAKLQNYLAEALDEIRLLSRGLSLPELDNLSLRQIVQRAANSHERRTQTQVAVEADGLEQTRDVDMSMKITVYRVIQEALMNAFQHAGGMGQRVSASLARGALALSVTDAGDGLAPQPIAVEADGLGLLGMRDRVESLGGTFAIESTPGDGTTVFASLPIASKG